ncbi:MAG: response regulator [bacterium]
MSQDIEVMVLDDEPIVCERLKDYLQKKGIAVETFNESERALNRLGEKTFDVIITDIKMKGPTGMDVLRAVKTGSLSTEVIIITGYGASENRSRCPMCTPSSKRRPKKRGSIPNSASTAHARKDGIRGIPGRRR